MFKHPFSFEGRITRTEYGISLLASPIYLFSSIFLCRQNNYLILVLLPIILWFLFAQSAKRCHDFGKSGWYQIPVFNFSNIEMIFKEGSAGDNEYGPNPRQTKKETS